MFRSAEPLARSTIYIFRSPFYAAVVRGWKFWLRSIFPPHRRQNDEGGWWLPALGIIKCLSIPFVWKSGIFEIWLDSRGWVFCAPARGFTRRGFRFLYFASELSSQWLPRGHYQKPYVPLGLEREWPFPTPIPLHYPAGINVYVCGISRRLFVSIQKAKNNGLTAATCELSDVHFDLRLPKLE